MRDFFAAIKLGVAALVFLASAAAWQPAAAQDFAGKRITMTIGFGAGGGVDLYGRILGSNLTRFLPGNPDLIVMNQVGAGGVVALNEWANKAEPNGLFVTIGAQSQLDPEALLRMDIKYDPTKFKYVGGVAAPSQALFIRKDALPRLTDKSQKPVVMAMVGATLRSGNYQALWGATFLGWNIRWVPGYQQTAEIRLAMERGEADMSSFGTVGDIKYLMDSGNFAVVSQSGTAQGGKRVPRPDLPNAPVMSDLLKGKIMNADPAAQAAYEYSNAVIDIGKWLALPPNTPDAIVATYVKAYDAVLKDPKFQQEVKKTDPDSPIATKTDLEKIVQELSKVSPKTLEFITAELKRQGLQVK